MFGRRKREFWGVNSERPSPEAPPDAVLDMGLDDARHMAHYRFAFIVVPDNLFGPRGPEFVDFFLQGQGKQVLGALWFILNSDIAIEPEAFNVEDRFNEEGDREFIVQMPQVSPEKLEAHFFGIHLPRTVLQTLTTPNPDLTGVRLIFLEETLFGFTMIGESRGPGSHDNLGDGPDATPEGMWQVMDEVFGGESPEPLGGITMGWSDE